MADETTDRDERTYEPTTMRLAEARKRGQIARSADLTGAAALLAALLVLALGARGLLEGLASMKRISRSEERGYRRGEGPRPEVGIEQMAPPKRHLN